MEKTKRWSLVSDDAYTMTRCEIKGEYQQINPNHTFVSFHRQKSTLSPFFFLP